MPVLQLFFSLKGRIGRVQWWLSSIILASLNISPSLILKSYDEFEGEYYIEILLFNLAMMYPSFAVDAKRFHDLDKSGRWAWFGGIFALLITSKGLGLLVLLGVTKTAMLFIVGVIWALMFGYLFVLGFLQGTAGRNRYGIDPSTVSIFRVPSV